LAVGEDGWRRRGRATKAAVEGVDFSYFLMKTESWILGVVGEGQRRNAISKKYPTRKGHTRRKLVLLNWAKKIAQTPKYGFVGIITARPSSFKTH
jgi:hypothetical protein